MDSVPSDVSLTFNFDVVAGSTISISADGMEVGTGEVIIGIDSLILGRAIRAGSPNGLYTVKYTACWPDNTCHDGQLQFFVQ